MHLPWVTPAVDPSTARPRRALTPTALSLLALLVGCSSDRILKLASPGGSDHTTVIIEGPESGAARQVVAVPPSGAVYLAVEPGPSRLTALLYPRALDPQRDPVRCGVRLSGDNLIPNDPVEVLASRPVDLSEGELPEFKAVSALEPRPEVSLVNCVADPWDCPNLEPHLDEGGPIDHESRHLAVVDEDLVYYSAETSTMTIPGQFTLYRYRFDAAGGEHRPIPGTASLTYRIVGLGYDGAHVRGSTVERYEFSVTPAGELSEAPRRPVEGMAKIAAARGVVLRYGAAGLIDDTGQIPPLNLPIEWATAINAQRAVAIAGSSVQVYEGTAWKLELGLDAAMGWRTAGDEDVLLVHHRDGRIFRRDESTREWEDLGTPFGAQVDLKGAAGLGNGRFAVAGQDGLLGMMRTNGRPCFFETVTPKNYRAVATDPNRRRLYGLLDDHSPTPNDTTALVWIDLPR